eukprot:gene658-biopygen561
MREAIALSLTHVGRTGPNPSVGCLIVKDGEVVGRGVTALGGRPHAEPQAIAEAGEKARGATAYVTLEPCAMCAAAISFARIRRLYYGAPDPKGGAVESGPRFYSQPTCHHAPEVYGGIAERQAADILRTFFRDRR